MKRNTRLWIAQGVLAAMFLLAGASKMIMSAAQMASPGPVQVPVPFVRFIGVCEILGAIGMIVPWLTGIRRGLTPLAIPTASLGLLVAYVAYGRSRRA